MRDIKKRPSIKQSKLKKPIGEGKMKKFVNKKLPKRPKKHILRSEESFIKKKRRLFNYENKSNGEKKSDSGVSGLGLILSIINLLFKK